MGRDLSVKERDWTSQNGFRVTLFLRATAKKIYVEEDCQISPSTFENI